MKYHTLGVLLVAALLSSPVQAQSIQQRVTTLEEQVDSLQNKVKKLLDDVKDHKQQLKQLTAVLDAQSALVGQLVLQNQTLQATLGCMSKTGDQVYFTGCNVHIVSGSGTTDGDVNGLGNLIVGYNEDDCEVGSGCTPKSRTGSHNLVMGQLNSYSSYGGAVFGRNNTITGPWASVTGGAASTASGIASSVSGGWINTASGHRSSVSGGINNAATGPTSSVSGGAGGTASGDTSSVSGGGGNTASGARSSVSGGSQNIANGHASSVSGGVGNVAGDGPPDTTTGTNRGASVSGGLNRTASGEHDWAGGEFFSEQ